MFQQVPIALMNGVIAVLEEHSRFVPALLVTAENGQIVRYYAAKSLWA